MNSIEKRREQRFKVELLPDIMKQYIVQPNPETSVVADIIDASLNGLGLAVPLKKENFVAGTNIAIYPIGKTYALYGTIIHVSKIDENSCRVGIGLKETIALEKYQRILRESVLKENVRK